MFVPLCFSTVEPLCWGEGPSESYQRAIGGLSAGHLRAISGGASEETDQGEDDGDGRQMAGKIRGCYGVSGCYGGSAIQEG